LKGLEKKLFKECAAPKNNIIYSAIVKRQKYNTNIQDEKVEVRRWLNSRF